MSRIYFTPTWVAIGLLASVVTAAAQEAPIAGGVYTCIDAKGRKLTADRPIPECIDREQRVLNPSGTLKAIIGPVLSVQERTALEQKEKKELEARARQAEERRKDHALLVRYPNQAVHDKERADALLHVEAVTKTANARLQELAQQRVAIDASMEFYTKNPAKAPAHLRRSLEENIASQAEQKRFIADQTTATRQVNLRFDDELVRLRQMWTPASK